MWLLKGRREEGTEGGESREEHPDLVNASSETTATETTSPGTTLSGAALLIHM